MKRCCRTGERFLGKERLKGASFPGKKFQNVKLQNVLNFWFYPFLKGRLNLMNPISGSPLQGAKWPFILLSPPNWFWGVSGEPTEQHKRREINPPVKLMACADGKFVIALVYEVIEYIQK